MHQLRANKRCLHSRYFRLLTLPDCRPGRIGCRSSIPPPEPVGSAGQVWFWCQSFDPLQQDCPSCGVNFNNQQQESIRLEYKNWVCGCHELIDFAEYAVPQPAETYNRGIASSFRTANRRVRVLACSQITSKRQEAPLLSAGPNPPPATPDR